SLSWTLLYSLNMHWKYYKLSRAYLMHIQRRWRLKGSAFNGRSGSYRDRRCLLGKQRLNVPDESQGSPILDVENINLTDNSENWSLLPGLTQVQYIPSVHKEVWPLSGRLMRAIVL